MAKHNSSKLHVEEETSVSVIFLTAVVMSIYILAVIGLIKKHLKVEETEDMILLVNKSGEVTEVTVDSIIDAEDEVLV